MTPSCILELGRLECLALSMTNIREGTGKDRTVGGGGGRIWDGKGAWLVVLIIDQSGCARQRKWHQSKAAIGRKLMDPYSLDGCYHPCPGLLAEIAPLLLIALNGRYYHKPPPFPFLNPSLLSVP